MSKDDELGEWRPNRSPYGWVLPHPDSDPDVSIARSKRTLATREKSARKRKCVQSEKDVKCVASQCPAWRRVDDKSGFCIYWRKRSV